jgi:hypothetical protein
MAGASGERARAPVTHGTSGSPGTSGRPQADLLVVFPLVSSARTTGLPRCANPTDGTTSSNQEV